MSLALVRWRGEDVDGAQRFDIEIGRNQFYTWAIGSGDRMLQGVRMLDRTVTTSPLLGPVDPSERGRVQLRVPADAFSDQGHHLQLLSFRDELFNGPAASGLVDVPWRWTPPARDDDPAWRPPDSRAAGLSTRGVGIAIPSGKASRRRRGSGPGPARRSVSSGPSALSQAQFLDALAGIVSQVLPMINAALPVVESLFPPGPHGRAAAPGAGPAAAPASGPAAAPAATPPVTPFSELLAALLRQVVALRSSDAPAAVATTRATSMRPALPPPRYATASFAPLLAALPALLPLLQQVLTPETVQAVIGAADPSKLLNTVFQGVADAARIGQEATDKLHQHLRELNPGLGDDVLIPLLAATASVVEPRAGASRTVGLAFDDVVGVELQGYLQVCVSAGSELRLPLRLSAPRALPASRLTVRLRDAVTQRVVATRTTDVGRLTPGRLDHPVVVPGALTSRVRPGAEVFVDATLSWPGRTGRLAVTVSQLVRVVGPLVFDALLPGGRPQRFDDVVGDRDWWHRVHTTTLADGVTRIDAEVCYDYRLDPELASGTRRRPTATQFLDEGRRRTGVLRGGLDVSAAELSRIAIRLGAAQALSAEVVTALGDPSFAAAYGRSARGRFVVRGRAGTRAALWAWPELALQTAVLRAPSATSPLTGQVVAFETVPAEVPVPVVTHLLTSRG